jgi:DNA recombination protein RmuC
LIPIPIKRRNEDVLTTKTMTDQTLLLPTLFIAFIAIALLIALLVVLLRQGARLTELQMRVDDVQQMPALVAAQVAAQMGPLLVQQLGAGNREVRETMLGQLAVFQQSLTQAVQGATSAQGQSVQALTQLLQNQVQQMAENNEKRLFELRATLDLRLREMQADAAKQLESIRHTVDEKLQTTLEARLGESFKRVSEQLEQVHRGLGEMQGLAADVGGLKRVLINVKTRGGWGETQLAMLLEQMLTAEQYGAQVQVKPGSSEKVDFAVKFPGRDDGPVWLPIDAKFPKESYERLLDASERADIEGIKTFGDALERDVRREAESISSKYIAPPHTTEFAVLYLPTEGLYAEVLRRPGLADELQRKHHITLAGPTTLAALLTSLQMGFRTLALEQRSSEVWEVLGAVKTEFGKFGDVLAKVKKTLTQAASNIGAAETRSRAMQKQLKNVESMPGEAAQKLLGLGELIEDLPDDEGPQD